MLRTCAEQIMLKTTLARLTACERCLLCLVADECVDVGTHWKQSRFENYTLTHRPRYDSRTQTGKGDGGRGRGGIARKAFPLINGSGFCCKLQFHIWSLKIQKVLCRICLIFFGTLFLHPPLSSAATDLKIKISSLVLPSWRHIETREATLSCRLRCPSSLDICIFH